MESLTAEPGDESRQRRIVNHVGARGQQINNPRRAIDEKGDHKRPRRSYALRQAIKGEHWLSPVRQRTRRPEPEQHQKQEQRRPQQVKRKGERKVAFAERAEGVRKPATRTGQTRNVLEPADSKIRPVRVRIGGPVKDAHKEYQRQPDERKRRRAPGMWLSANYGRVFVDSCLKPGLLFPVHSRVFDVRFLVSWC